MFSERPATGERAHGHAVLLTGLSHFCATVADMLSEEPGWRTTHLAFAPDSTVLRRTWALASALSHACVWYQIGGYIGRGRILHISSALGATPVLHWVGSDVSAARSYSDRHRRFADRMQGWIHWAGAPWLVDELRELRIESRFVPLPLPRVRDFLAVEPPPLPARFVVLTYMSARAPETYGASSILRLARDLPAVDVRILGASAINGYDWPANVTFLGWLPDVSQAFSEATVLVRMASHDGYGGTVQEALAMGRHAVWTYPFPGVCQARNYEELREHVVSLGALHKSGSLALNLIGRDYLGSELAPRTTRAALVDEIAPLCGRRHRRGSS